MRGESHICYRTRDGILVLPMPVSILLAEAEGWAGREESMSDEAVCPFGVCSRHELCTKRDPMYSPGCIVSTVWGTVTIVSGKCLGESVQKVLNVEAVDDNLRGPTFRRECGAQPLESLSE